MPLNKEFPLENDGDYKTHVSFDTPGEVTFWRAHSGEIRLTKAQFQEAIRLSIGHLFDINAVDEVLLARHCSDQILAGIAENEKKLQKIATSTTRLKDAVEESDMTPTLIRSCICIAIMALRSVRGIPPVQGEQS